MLDAFFGLSVFETSPDAAASRSAIQLGNKPRAAELLKQGTLPLIRTSRSSNTGPGSFPLQTIFVLE
jgi:hypothetical protein